MKAKPFAKARYFIGSTSDGIACIIEIVLKVTPISIPPPINVVIDCALADTTAPAKAIRGGIEARYFRSTTSERRPMIGESADCIKSGPCEGQLMGLYHAHHKKVLTWMIQPARAGSPRSRMMNAMTLPAATTTKTWAIILRNSASVII